MDADTRFQPAHLFHLCSSPHVKEQRDVLCMRGTHLILLDIFTHISFYQTI